MEHETGYRKNIWMGEDLRRKIRFEFGDCKYIAKMIDCKYIVTAYIDGKDGSISIRMGEQMKRSVGWLNRF